ncbi:chemotaxis protein CheD [Sporolactobacillus sp. THM7-4]|nr:chemotaxis protein CheD [Sporolactobacillus sp. THM7-4]
MIHVGLAEIKFAEEPEILRTMGLGSCVAAILYSESKHLAGMAHVMLPDSGLARTKTFPPGKFADTAIPEIVRVLTDERRIPLCTLKAKLAGGAEMFQLNRSFPLVSIGERNVAAVKEQLNKFQIPVVAEETGKDYGRTIEFDTGSGELVIRAISRGKIII